MDSLIKSGGDDIRSCGRRSFVVHRLLVPRGKRTLDSDDSGM